MDARKRKRLEAGGWHVGRAADFLELSAEEAALVETRLAVSGALKERRLRQGVTQAALAKKLRSSQSRVAKMEAGDPTISLDLLLRAFFATTSETTARPRFGRVHKPPKSGGYCNCPAAERK